MKLTPNQQAHVASAVSTGGHIVVGFFLGGLPKSIKYHPKDDKGKKDTSQTIQRDSYACKVLYTKTGRLPETVVLEWGGKDGEKAPEFEADVMQPVLAHVSKTTVFNGETRHDVFLIERLPDTPPVSFASPAKKQN